MDVRGLMAVLLAGPLFLAACQPGTAPAGPSSPLAPAPAAPQHVLRIVTTDLPTNFSAKPLAAAGGATGVFESSAGFLFNATFALLDERGHESPYLAESLPQLDTDTWKVFPDGTMETTYRLRPNVTWHDGAPLTAEDFVFAWQVFATPDYGVSS